MVKSFFRSEPCYAVFYDIQFRLEQVVCRVRNTLLHITFAIATKSFKSQLSEADYARHCES